MLIDIDKWEADRIAAIDSDGTQLTYGQIRALAELIEHSMPAHSLLFLLTENNVGGIAWVMASILAGQVPLILNAHTEPALLGTLTNTYLPEYIVAPADRTDSGR